MLKTKTIIKEIGIVLLLILAVSLLLAVIFYDYIPNNKTVPIKIQAYNIPEDVKDELSNVNLDEQNIVKTYYIDSSDLDLYESTNDYDKGKANPFADYSTKETANSVNTSNGTNKNTTNSDNDINANNNNIQNDEETTNKNEVYITTPGKNY